MNKFTLFICLLIYSAPIFAQDGFVFETGVKKVRVPFKLINNLVFIPVKVNGVELTFLLDSGVAETILFSLEEQKEVNLKNTQKISLRGLGSEEAVEGLKSEGNLLDVNGLLSTKHLLYVILDQNFNMSSHVGIPVNGIIGYPFFKNNLVEINYEKKRLQIYRENRKIRRRLDRKYKEIAISLEGSKPYASTSVIIDSEIIPTKLLVDVGNSDAIWLFENSPKKVSIPQKSFDDYLGRGFSGDVTGKRARISEFMISDFKFSNPIVAFPDSSSLRHVKMVPDRLGSIGGEILKRFSVVFDYPNNKMFLRKNRSFYSAFSYNKSGIEIRHFGLQWVRETVNLHSIPVVVDHATPKGYGAATEFKYKFQLKPIYEIANLRRNSPGENSGLKKGDIIKSINGNQAYRYSLDELNSFLKSEEEEWITLEIERESQVLKYRFQLKDIL